MDKLPRREFIKTVVIGGTATLLSGCAPDVFPPLPTVTPIPKSDIEKKFESDNGPIITATPAPTLSSKEATQEVEDSHINLIERPQVSAIFVFLNPTGESNPKGASWEQIKQEIQILPRQTMDSECPTFNGRQQGCVVIYPNHTSIYLGEEVRYSGNTDFSPVVANEITHRLVVTKDLIDQNHVIVPIDQNHANFGLQTGEIGSIAFGDQVELTYVTAGTELLPATVENAFQLAQKVPEENLRDTYGERKIPLGKSLFELISENPDARKMLLDPAMSWNPEVYFKNLGYIAKNINGGNYLNPNIQSDIENGLFFAQVVSLGLNYPNPVQKIDLPLDPGDDSSASEKYLARANQIRFKQQYQTN
jgi:hypothetical protein